jgi:transposase
MGVQNIKNLFQGDMAMKIVAMDMGKSKTVVCYFEAAKGSHRYLTVPTRPQLVHDAIIAEKADRVVIEIGAAAGWVCDVCKTIGIEIQVANTNHEGWRWKNVKKKGDREDALKLARLSAAGDLPLVYVPQKEIRQRRSLISYRQSLVKRRTQIMNNIRSIFDREGLAMYSGSKAWNRAGIKYLESESKEPAQCSAEELWRGELHIELAQLASTKNAIEQIEKKLDALGQQDRGTQILMSVPGIGTRLSEAMSAAIDDAARFENGKQIGSYFGLTPRRYQSGSTDRQGKISGCGNKLVRSMLIQVSWVGLKYSPWMRGIYERARRGSKSRKKIAIVAVARHVAVLCWVLLKEDRFWQERKVA